MTGQKRTSQTQRTPSVPYRYHGAAWRSVFFREGGESRLGQLALSAMDQWPCYGCLPSEEKERSCRSHIYNPEYSPGNTYHVPLNPGARKRFGNASMTGFSCCNGTALESNTKLQDQFYV